MLSESSSSHGSGIFEGLCWKDSKQVLPHRCKLRLNQIYDVNWLIKQQITPSSCPICHYGHRAPFGLGPNPALRFRCAPPSPRRTGGGRDVSTMTQKGEKNGQKRWLYVMTEKLSSQPVYISILLMFLTTQTPDHDSPGKPVSSVPTAWGSRTIFKSEPVFYFRSPFFSALFPPPSNTTTRLCSRLCSSLTVSPLWI